VCRIIVEATNWEDSVSKFEGNVGKTLQAGNKLDS